MIKKNVLLSTKWYYGYLEIEPSTNVSPEKRISTKVACCAHLKWSNREKSIRMLVYDDCDLENAKHIETLRRFQSALKFINNLWTITLIDIHHKGHVTHNQSWFKLNSRKLHSSGKSRQWHPKTNQTHMTLWVMTNFPYMTNLDHLCESWSLSILHNTTFKNFWNWRTTIFQHRK